MRHLAIVFLLLMFVLSGFNKVAHFDKTVTSLSTKANWIPYKRSAILIVILIEIFAPLLILKSSFGEKTRCSEVFRRVSVYSLVVFTVLATLLYHPFKLNSSYMKNVPFFSNLSLIGGLLMLS